MAGKLLMDIVAALNRFRVSSAPQGSPAGWDSWLDEPATDAEIDDAWPKVHPDVRQLWLATRETKLFFDDDGDWGLHLLSPAGSAEDTAYVSSYADLRPGEIVIAGFIGDLDFVVVEPSGSILVIPETYSRPNWFAAAPDLGSFIDGWFTSHGEKYWEGA
jgi:hypothetical protein